jgi:hypothetical protein
VHALLAACGVSILCWKYLFKFKSTVRDPDEESGTCATPYACKKCLLLLSDGQDVNCSKSFTLVPYL